MHVIDGHRITRWQVRQVDAVKASIALRCTYQPALQPIQFNTCTARCLLPKCIWEAEPCHSTTGRPAGSEIRREMRERSESTTEVDETDEPGSLRAVAFDDQFAVLLNLGCQLVKCLSCRFCDWFLIGRGNPADRWPHRFSLRRVSLEGRSIGK